MNKKIKSALLSALILCTAACGGDDDEPGELVITAYGEDYIENGFTTEDGWALSFENFLVTFEDIQLGELDLNQLPAVELARASNGEGHEMHRMSHPSGTYGDANYSISRVEIRGSAAREGEIKTFDWLFEQTTRYFACDNKTVITPDQPATLELTIHADHLFFDSLVSGDPALLFNPLAVADLDGDGEITPEELAQTDIGSYDPGNEGIDDLWDWLLAQSRTLGHIDGEEHCEFEPVL